MENHITIGATTPWGQIHGSDLDPENKYFFDFPIFKAEDLEVYVDGVLKALDTDYVVYWSDGADPSAGGWLQFLGTPPGSESVITFRRYLEIRRTTDFQESGEFRAKVLNDELDYLVAAIQQIANEVRRSLQQDPTDPEAKLLLPTRDTRKGKFLWFDPETGDLVPAAVIPETLVSTYMVDVVTASSLAEARDAMEVPAETDVVKRAESATLTAGYMQEPVEYVGAESLANQEGAEITLDLSLSNGFVIEADADGAINAPVSGFGDFNVTISNVAGPRSLTLTGFDTISGVLTGVDNNEEYIEGRRTKDKDGNAIVVARIFQEV